MDLKGLSTTMSVALTAAFVTTAMALKITETSGSLRATTTINGIKRRSIEGMRMVYMWDKANANEPTRHACFGIRGGWGGVLLWPAVVVHAGLTVLLVRGWP